MRSVDHQASPFTPAVDDDSRPFDGSPSWRIVRTLPDGATITIRPIAAEDREGLRQGFLASSEQTRYLRFLSSIGTLSEAALDYLTNVDQKNHIALVATMTSPDLKFERGVGVARAIRLSSEPDVAEAAITVVDDMQRRGVGSALGLELERAARASGIRVLRAEVLKDNEAMRTILASAGARQVKGEEESTGALSYDIELGPTGSSWIRDILRGAARTMAISVQKLLHPFVR